jgi:prefoldin subunit 5
VIRKKIFHFDFRWSTHPLTMTAEVASSDDETTTALAAATIGGDNGRGIPSVKFVSEDVGVFVDGIFGGGDNTIAGATTVSAELLIGAFSQLHAKYKSSEASLQGKRTLDSMALSLFSGAFFLSHPHKHTSLPFFLHYLSCCHIYAEENLKQKIPELQKSIAAIQTLMVKQQQQQEDAKPISIRYALSDNIYAKAQLVQTNAPNVVYLWLGANVMLEYEYDEALIFLRNNHAKAERDLATISNDLSFVRDQIVTSEVNMSRIFNWDVRRRRQTTTTTTSSVAPPMQS